MVLIKYCAKCGNTGLTWDNKPCDCGVNMHKNYGVTGAIEIPEQYRGVMFNSFLVPKDVHESYAAKLQNIYSGILDMCSSPHNYVIASPVNHSKTILAY